MRTRTITFNYREEIVRSVEMEVPTNVPHDELEEWFYDHHDPSVDAKATDLDGCFEVALVCDEKGKVLA